MVALFLGTFTKSSWQNFRGTSAKHRKTPTKLIRVIKRIFTLIITRHIFHITESGEKISTGEEYPHG